MMQISLHLLQIMWTFVPWYPNFGKVQHGDYSPVSQMKIVCWLHSVFTSILSDDGRWRLALSIYVHHVWWWKMTPWASAGTKAFAAITAFYSPYENSVSPADSLLTQTGNSRTEVIWRCVRHWSAFLSPSWLTHQIWTVVCCLLGLVCYWLVWWEKEIIRAFKAE